MHKSEALPYPLVKIVAVALLSLIAASNSSAQGVDRTDQLEKEIQEIKIRLLKLEAAQGGATASQKAVVVGEGWKSLSNWRRLKSDMTPSDVRSILGEPNRIDGGVVAYWHYQNEGVVTFVRERLSQWNEPH